MKKFFLIPLAALLFTACSSKSVVVNDIPAKKTYVKADAPGEPEYKGNPNSVYDDGPRYHGYWGHYYY
ncbi:MAG: hypothetical protein DSZ05_07205 [Sulfurospirillum sp.]|nr:MAG: hypothetical protein DSZ05_07205 [Sulfurospirillum sp.]